MPKQIDYPRASLKNCMALCEAVNDLGGECSAAMAADKTGKQPTSGAYKALIGAAVKYGLLTNKKGQLAVTQVFRDIKLAYNEEEAKIETQKAFLSPALFSDIFKRFENKKLPVSHFEKLLIREFDVPDAYASRISSYFLEGAKQSGLLGDGDMLTRNSASADDEVIDNGNDDDEPTNSPRVPEKASKTNIDRDITHPEEVDGKFSVRIRGPGMDSLIVINEEEDLDIVKAMLKKVGRRLSVEEWDGD